MIPLNVVIAVFTGGNAKDATKENKGQKKRLVALVVDKQKRAEELSKLCAELKGKEYGRQKENKKQSETKKKETQDNHSMLRIMYDDERSTCPNRSIEIRDVMISPELDDASVTTAEEQNATITLSQHSNQCNDSDLASTVVDLQTTKTRNEDIKINCAKNSATTSSEIEPNPSDKNNSLDPCDIVRIDSLVEKRSERKSSVKNCITTDEKKSSDTGDSTTTMNALPSSSLHHKNPNRESVNIQSKMDFYASNFRQKVEETHRPKTSLDQKSLPIKIDTSKTQKTPKKSSVDFNILSYIGLKPNNIKTRATDHKMDRVGGPNDSRFTTLSRRKQNIPEAENTITTSEKKENNTGMHSPTIDLTIPASLDHKSINTTSIQSKRDLFERGFDQKVQGKTYQSLASPNRKQSDIDSDIPRKPKTLKRGFIELNQALPESKYSDSKSLKPSKRVLDGICYEKDKVEGFVGSAMALLFDKSLESEVRSLAYQIDQAGGFPRTRRLSLRDNELVGKMVRAIRNDPSIESIDVSPRLFGTISSTLLEQFVQSLRINLHLKSITLSGIELGNDFLYSLATSMESNLVLEEINLSNNLFTNEGLAEFCQVVAVSNETLTALNLENQTTPISNASEDDVLNAFQKNKTIQQVKLDFQSNEAAEHLTEIVNRNKGFSPIKTLTDEKLINLLKLEVKRAQHLLGDRHGGDDSLTDTEEKDWDYLHELSVQFDKHKLNNHIQEASEGFVPPTLRINGDSMTKEEKKNFLFGTFQKSLGESIGCFNSNGSFLTAEFISSHFVDDTQSDGLTFDFHGQWRLFKRFPVHDPSRQFIVRKFVDVIVTHPRANDITAINMANTGCGDDFLVSLANRCLNNESILANLIMLDLETNCIKGDGIIALAKAIESRTTLKYLQVVRLENQKCLHKSEAETALAKAMRVNFSIVVMSFRARNLKERQEITKYVLRNVELLRQARQKHFKATGRQRERNEVEQLFDRIAENDEMIDTVDLVGNQRFMALTSEEKNKAANAFARNTNVKTIKFNSCGIDDEFAINLSNSLKRNTTITKVSLEGNSISGAGITALFEALAENSTIEELKLHKQSKVINTSEEHTLANILQPNMSVMKLGLDLRTTMAQVQLDKKLCLNRNMSLRLRAEAKGENFRPGDAFSFIRF